MYKLNRFYKFKDYKKIYPLFFLLYNLVSVLPCIGTYCKVDFQTGFVVAVGGFLSVWNHQLIKFEEEKIFGL